MSLNILISVALGMGLGYILSFGNMDLNFDIIIDLGLMGLLFFVGIDIGQNKNLFSIIRRLGRKVILIPLIIILGSITGAILAGYILGIPYNEAGAIGAGLGWYSLSAMLVSTHSAELSTLAFLSNVIREVLALIMIPIVAKYIGKYETIGTSAATSMDTCLPLISRCTDSETTIMAFITGVICTVSVPIIVPLILNI